MYDRVVYDTNVWISGLLWRGKPHHCILLARSGIVRPVYCRPMLDELIRKLREAFKFPEGDLQIVNDELAQMGDSVEILGHLDVVESDPTDNKFLECALAGNASVVVTGDKHLLRLKSFDRVDILTPADFLRSFHS